MSDVKVLVLVGSLRAASINRQIATLAAESSPQGIDVTVYDGVGGGGLGDLPFYNEDTDTPADVPASVTHLRKAVADTDAILVVTPEYNGSIPGVLKNAIDWLSRPYGRSALNGKPLAVIGTSLGQYGGVWAHDETRKSFGIAGAHVVHVSFSLPATKLEGKPPRDNAEVVDTVNDVLTKLAAEAG
ncbi:MAG: NAD(P)H-dependent oxidoreductase [Mycobacteriaceae bacterium]|nr:NAD(P)H-dependent oxidoreductase [Mycobacteriaceae bacterium]